ncbi:MAG: YfhO family protein [Chloroflexi bacterium]|nr:YfhO family protein [Chloroflexota bacterium]
MALCRQHLFRCSKGRLLSVIPVLIMAALTLGYFWRYVWLGEAYLPADILSTWYPWRLPEVSPVVHNRLISDAINTHFPSDVFYWQQIRQSQPALWNPNILAGDPVLASAMTAQMYPIKLAAFLLLPAIDAQAVLLIVHTFLAGLFAYMLMRNWGLSRPAALLSGIAWMFNGYVGVWLEFNHTVIAAALLPLVLLLYEKANRTGSWQWVAMAGFALGLASLGNSQRASYVAFALLALHVFRQISLVRSGGIRASLPANARFGLILLIALGLAAVQILPSAELQALGQQRTISGIDDLKTALLRLALLGSFVLPTVAGSPILPFELFSMAGTNYNELQGYAGIVPLALAIVALFRSRKPETWFLGCLGALALALAVFNPLIPVFRLVPVISSLNHTRLLLLYGFSVAMLSGIGLDWLISRSDCRRVARRATIVAGLATLSAAAAVALVGAYLRAHREEILGMGTEFVRTRVYQSPGNPYSLEHYYRQVEDQYNAMLAHYIPWGPSILPYLLLGFGCVMLFWLASRKRIRPVIALTLVLTAADLMVFGASYNTTSPRQNVYPISPAIEFLRSDRDTYRVMLDTSDGNLFANTLMPFGIQEIGGYDSLYPGAFGRLAAAIEDGTPTGRELGNLVNLTRWDSRLLDLLNVKYVLVPPDKDIANSRFRQVYQGELRIYENLRVLPRAFVVPTARAVPDEKQALEMLLSDEFDFRRQVLVADAGPESMEPTGQTGTSLATVERYAPKEVEVHVETETGGYLVLSDTYYPGWTATVDGRSVPIHRANLALRAVAVPAGGHDVRFSYEPQSFQWGLGVTLATLALVLAIGLANTTMLRLSAVHGRRSYLRGSRHNERRVQPHLN